MREKRNTITDEMVKEVLAMGTAKAKTYAATTMDKVRQAIGINL